MEVQIKEPLVVVNRGEPGEQINGMGVKTFVALCKKLAASYGEHFRPTPLLKDTAARGETFYGRVDPDGAASKAA